MMTTAVRNYADTQTRRTPIDEMWNLFALPENESEEQQMETMPVTTSTHPDLAAASGPVLRVLESCKLETRSYADVSQVN